MIRFSGKKFSLVELIIVFAILAILAALLQPALQTAKRAAGFVGCSQNLKQIGVGHFTYMEDNDGFFHSTDFPNSLVTSYYLTYDPSSIYQKSHRAFNQNPRGYLEPYLGAKGSKVYQCPDYVLDTESNFYNRIKHEGSSTYRGFRSANGVITNLRDYVFPQNNVGQPGPGFLADKTFKPITWDFMRLVPNNIFFNIGESIVHGNTGDAPILFSDGHTKVSFFPVSEWPKYNWALDESYLRAWYD